MNPMQLNVHFVVHEAFEAPAAFETWVEQRGYAASYSRVYLGEGLPRTTDDIDLLVVLGGPQSPSTTIEECPHFDSAAEQALIARYALGGKAVVGVCLGAQLMSEALGAAHAHSPEKEIGNFPIELTEYGKKSRKFCHFGDGLMVGHWHGDMPGLTADAKVIARSEGCPRQIVEYGELVYGSQCHLELTPGIVELLIQASSDELGTLASHRFVQPPAILRTNDYADMNQKLFRFLDELVQSYRGHA
jgi:GMP synthase (glutamine-hydrolysing)